MTSLTGYIQGLGGGEKRTVDKQGTEIKLSVFDNIDRVIVFNEAGETSQKTLTGKNLVNFNNGQPYSGSLTSNYFESTLNKNTLNRFELQEGVTYTFSADVTSDIEPFYMTVGAGSGGYSKDIKAELNLTSGRISCTFTPTADNLSLGNVFCFRLPRYATSQTFNFSVSNVQLEKGSLTPYEEYCGGVPSPNPSYPQDINGIGFKRPDGTYTVTISYDDGDEHFGTIIASGLAYPLYEGDVLDFVNGKVIRNNGSVDLGSLSWTYSTNFLATIDNSKVDGKSFCTIYQRQTGTWTLSNNTYRIGTNAIRIRDDNYTDAPTFTTAVTGEYLVYELVNPVDEYITLSGDISDIGTATVTADGTLTVKYDKAEMAIRKYSPKPDWSKIGYSNTPNAVINAFDYAKRIYDTWSFQKYTSDLNLRIFPNVDITGQLGLDAMFKNCTNLINLPPLTIGTDSGTLNASEFARASGIEEVTITSNNLNQENNFQNGFNGCSFLKSYSITAKASNVNAMFSGCSSLIEAPDFDTSTTANFSEMFSGCSSLTYVSDDFDTSSGTNFYRCFYNCSSLESIPSWDVRTGTNLQQLFAGCSSIKNVPPLVITSATNLTNMFQNSGSNLTELSRNNILMMLATASSYTGTKTLAAVGFTSSMYSAASWQALTNYGDFTTAGWSIGYS